MSKEQGTRQEAWWVENMASLDSLRKLKLKNNEVTFNWH